MRYWGGRKREQKQKSRKEKTRWGEGKTRAGDKWRGEETRKKGEEERKLDDESREKERSQKRCRKGRKHLGSRSKICLNSPFMGTVSSTHCHTTQHKVEYAHLVPHIHTHPLPSSLAMALIPPSVPPSFKTWMPQLSEPPEASYLYPFFRAPLRQNP